MTMKKTWFTLASVMLLVGVLSGCSTGSSGGKTQASSAPATVSATPPAKIVFTDGVWKQPNDKALPQYETWKKQFEQEYPNVTFKPEAFAYDVNTFLPKAVSGDLPNLFGTFFTETTKIIGAGFAADITPELKQRGYDTKINPAMLELATKDGKIYGIPYGGYYLGIWYNLNLFKQAGLLDVNGVPKFPQTYDELAATAKIIKDKTGKSGFFFPTKNNQGGWQFTNLAYAFGTEFEKQENGKWTAAFNSPQGVQALQYVKDLKWKYNVLPDNNLVDVNDMFKMMGTDQVAMAFGMSGWANIPINDVKMNKDNMAMSSVPAGPAGKVALMGGNVYMFSANSTKEQIDAGINWLKITGFSPDAAPDALKGLEDQYINDVKLGRVIGPQGLTIWANSDRTKAEDELRKKFTNVNMALWNSYADNKDVKIKPEPPINAQELYKALDIAIQTVLTDKNADPKKLLDQTAAAFQKDYLDKAK